MAKTIRSHPTSPFILPEPIFWTTLIFSKFGAKNGATFSSFSDLPTSKKTGPQRKTNVHGPSLHTRLLSKIHVLYCIYHHVFTVGKKPTFLN